MNRPADKLISGLCSYFRGTAREQRATLFQLKLAIPVLEAGGQHEAAAALGVLARQLEQQLPPKVGGGTRLSLRPKLTPPPGD